MRTALSPAEAILHRTGPNTITVLFEAAGPFDPARAFRGVQMLANGSARFSARLHRGALIAGAPINWADHVCVLNDPHATVAPLMDLSRCLHLSLGRPLWRAMIVNPDGPGWSGVALHFDHAIADGTRIARHLASNVKPLEDDVAPVDMLPSVGLSDLATHKDPRVVAAPIGLCRVPFDGLRRAVGDAVGHGDALLRLGRRIVDDIPEFDAVPTGRKDHATVAKIETLQSGGRLGNHARMEDVDLSKPSSARDGALFRPRRTPRMERLRMAVARGVPASLLRRIVEAEFSRPAIVQTIVPVSRRPVPLFGLPLHAIHSAAPALGRPLMAITAVRYGDGFDVSITAHGPCRVIVPDLSMRVAAAIARAVQ